MAVNYETVIGLEIHSELSTKTKIFCGCTTEFGGEQNTHCCPVCTGMPGTLPVLNVRVVEFAAKAGIAMNCKISNFSKFDRKNYFYPDLPKAYQISQYDLPLCIGGYITLDNGKKIGITRIHIEEDAGKLIHDDVAKRSYVDYNRCGVPLIEIVSEPDMRNSDEVREYVEKVRAILLYAGVSDCRMEEGSLRADVNLSVRPFGQEKFGTRTEMKNINSIRAIVRAVEGETVRQIEVITAGGKIEQQTRRWDDNKGTSKSLRGKEEANDYRYFPEPDLVPTKLDDEKINEIKSMLPELPDARLKKYILNGIAAADAQIIVVSKALSDFFEEASTLCGNSKEAAKWIVGEMMRQLKDREIEPENIPFKASYLADIINLCSANKITAAAAKKLFSMLFESSETPLQLVEKHSLATIGDDNAIDAAIEKIISENPKSIEDYISGKDKAFGFLMGQAMKELKGKADPGIIREKLTAKLEKFKS
jgi:aspartyl-tRNA(Asn)/glutamyl-tRNA(Gln) amidotransferase subunit B